MTTVRVQLVEPEPAGGTAEPEPAGGTVEPEPERGTADPSCDSGCPCLPAAVFCLCGNGRVTLDACVQRTSVVSLS